MSAISSRPLVSTLGESKQDTSEYGFPDMSLLDITEGENERKIPIAKFIDDVGAFCSSFTPVPASAELLIGAYTELHAKYKSFEVSLTNKRNFDALHNNAASRCILTTLDVGFDRISKPT
ncbi:predicted protein [Phaeodactylum tricornutum CCAP 1055/1]|uniref:Uncharacterized protein n=2 Tax=Phaeodactylum tricornutum TaxID=2850 RepID=B7FSV4_PHATC|nr:predicted protein [Phaeodactylum tricornutum CCAP 1055/1]EEC50860.1 predicted protein [Phaeodactylum tricornutum CCAP 1055/1]|eukprot:XP_002178046.1 predicted protein [Phaeodactylum tricornutum CCAP 1055/1]